MRIAAGLFLAIALGIAAFYGVVILASESGEVVTLRTRDEGQNLRSTRLWVVDHAGAEWVRTGHVEKGWFERVLLEPIVELERAGTTSERMALPVLDESVDSEVDDAFSRKYGAADWVVALSGDASSRVVVRLDPAGR